MKPLDTLSLTVALVVLAKTAAWLWQLRNRNAGMVDAIWACTLGSLAFVYAVAGDAPVGLRVLLAVMGGAWGLRLGVHLWIRNYGKPEDWRYAQLRAEWGDKANHKMFWFFQFQNVFTIVLAASAFAPVAYRSGTPASWAIGLAVGLWLLSVIGEGVADRQMERFRLNPANKGKVCRDGLWRYSRHPNYFFECLHWLAYAPLAIDGGAWGWTVLVAPLVMAFLLLKLSGVPMLEAEMVQRKPGYAEYLRTTNALIPWWPKGRETGNEKRET